MQQTVSISQALERSLEHIHKSIEAQEKACESFNAGFFQAI
jgi:hypothetical protein